MLEFVEFLKRETGLTNDGAQSSLGQIVARVVRNDRAVSRNRMVPNFMASFGVTVKNESGFTQFINNVDRFEDRQTRQAAEPTGIFVSSLKDRKDFFLDRFLGRIAAGSGSLRSIIESIILRATSSAISIVSAMVRPCAIRPCSTRLVAKNPPSFNSSTVMGMMYSDMIFILNGSIAYFVLGDQLSRSCKAIPRLIAEGYAKRHQKCGFQKYLDDAMAECNETIVSLSQASDLYSNFLDKSLCEDLIGNYDIAGRQLYRLRESWGRFKTGAKNA